jgi:hypothetical protein
MEKQPDETSIKEGKRWKQEATPQKKMPSKAPKQQEE